MRLLLVILCVCLPALAQLPNTKRVTLEFVNANLIYVLKVLAREMGRNLYVAPGIEESQVTVSLRSVSPEAALALLLEERDLDYVLHGTNTLVVGEPGLLKNVVFTPCLPSPPSGTTFQEECLLGATPAAKVMEFLAGQYRNVVFIPHPTMNGFYVYGSRKDVLAIRAELPNLDRIPEPPPPPQLESVRVRHADIHDLKGLMQTLVPDLDYSVDGRQNNLILEGSPFAIQQVKELVAEFDRPIDQVMIDVKLLDLGTGGAKLMGVPPAPRSPLVVAPPSCICGASRLGYVLANSDARILAAPRVAVKNGAEGSFPEQGLKVLPVVERGGMVKVRVKFDKRVEEASIKDGADLVVSGLPGSGDLVYLIRVHVMR